MALGARAPFIFRSATLRRELPSPRLQSGAGLSSTIAALQAGRRRKAKSKSESEPLYPGSSPPGDFRLHLMSQTCVT